MTNRIRVAALTLGACIAIAALPLAQEPQQRPTTLAGRSTVYAPHAVIATSQPLASAAGLAVMQRGGNAIDAAVAAAAVLTVVEPHMVSMGGDLFAMVWSAKEGTLRGLGKDVELKSIQTPELLLQAIQNATK